jgi:hypothetical protein
MFRFQTRRVSQTIVFRSVLWIRIRFLQDPELEVMDPDPELDLNLTKNHQKNLQFDNSDIKNTLILHFY